MALDLRVTDRVRCVSIWSEFWSQAGVVVQVEPCVMVILDGYVSPIRIDVESLALESDE